MLIRIILVIVICNHSHGRLMEKRECLEEDEIQTYIKEFNFIEFAQGTWFDLFAYDHPFNDLSRCVRTTFFNQSTFHENVPLMTNFIDSKNLLTRILGSSKYEEKSKGYEVDYYAIPKLRTSFTVLDVIYTEYALLYACIDHKYHVWITSRSRSIKPQILRPSEEIFDINLPTSHLSQYFNSLSKRWIEKINKTSDENFYKKFINSDQYDKEICWGYEYNCKKPINLHRCTGNHTGYVQSKEAQLDVFHAQADFGYIKEQLKEMMVICEPIAVHDSSLDCSEYLRFCRGRNLMLNFTNLKDRKEPFRWQNDVLKNGDIGGYCKFNKELLDKQMMFMSALQSWAPEMRNFQQLNQRPIEHELCDVIIEKPTFIVKLDSTINMYHHFCDFFNLYVSQFVNFSHPNAFSTNVNILIWETYNYWSPFAQTFEAFTENRLWNLNEFSGKSVCFKNVVFPIPPRTIYGLYYNTPIINGCENSALFNAFSEHILHRLNIDQISIKSKKPKIRITFLSRNTKYRNVLNEQELIKKISSNEDYEVNRVVFDKNIRFIDQLKVTVQSDVFIGIHGAGLTHLLFLPKWATLFELHNCGDPNCYKDLARLRGINYITWSNDMLAELIDAGYKDGSHDKFKNYKFNAAEFERLVAIAVKAVRNNEHYKKFIDIDMPISNDEL